jgi:hypothetical protein
MSRTLLLFALSLAACDGESVQAEPLPAEQLAAVFADGDDWGRLTDFEAQAATRTNAIYARAVGRTVHRFTSQNFQNECSGGFVDDDILVTSHHCSQRNGATSDFQKIAFGKWGDTDGDVTAALEYLEDRLVRLGVPTWRVAQIDLTVLHEWGCDRLAQDGSRDVEFWSCRKKDLTWTENGQTVTWELLPGQLYGHLEVADTLPNTGEDLYGISQNRHCPNGTADQSNSVLLSPGELEQAMASCALGYGTTCFKTYADWLASSSGGPILDADHRVFGVMHGEIPGQSNVCDTYTPTGVQGNYGAYLGTQVDTYLSEDADGGGDPVGSWAGVLDRFGGTLGTAKYLACPAKMLAAGVVGTTTSTGILGHFGLVCMPNTSHGTRVDQRLDRARVVSPGAADVGTVSSPLDFNVFMAETLGVFQPDDGQHSLLMCPPGFFLSGVQGFESPNTVYGIRCGDPESGTTVNRYV